MKFKPAGKHLFMGAAIALAALLAGCGGGGGGGDAPVAPPTAPADIPLALMVDSMGRQLPEAEFGKGDAAAAGADGIAFDGAPMANAQVTLSDSGGIVRTGTTDASGYYRIDIKSLRPPLAVKVKRADGTEWFSATTAAPVVRGFLPININGLTEKTLGYVADALNIGGGAASAVTAPVLASNVTQLDAAKVKLRSGLAVPLVNAGLDAASYDPVTTSMTPANADKHAAFLRGLVFSRNATGRVAVIGTVTGSARPFAPTDVVVDSSGNMLIPDANTNSIRKISPGGVETTLAGSGERALVDGAGTAAAFNGPNAIALGADGTLYVADGLNHAIRKVSPTGVVSTLAGGAGPGSADGTGAAATFYIPNALALDRSGNVYVTEANATVRRITPAGVVTTIAGSALASGTSSVRGVALDGAGNLYYGYSGPDKGAIIKMTPAGDATDLYRAPAGSVFVSHAIAVDGAGTVYVGDRTMLLRITAAGQASTLAGAGYGSADGNGASARFGQVDGIVLAADGNLLIADRGNGSIRKVTPAGDVTTVLGKRPAGFVDGPAASALFSGESTFISIFRSFKGMGGVAVDAAGNIYLADIANHAIRRIAPTGAVTTVAGNGTAGFANGNGRSATFSAPTSVAVDGSGNIYVADTGNGAVRKISPAGDVSTLASGVQSPTHVAVGREGTVYVSSEQGVLRIDPAGVVTTLAPLAYDAGFYGLGAIAVDAAGTVRVKGGGVYNNVFSISGAGVRQVLTNFQPPWVSPTGMAADGNGNIYYLLFYNVDGSKGKLVRRSPAGVETEIAVEGRLQLLDYRGAELAVDGNGNIFVVDDLNAAIRVVLP